jgi:hypothetical protein
VTIIPSNSRVVTVCWTRDDYTVYLLTEPPPNENSNNFWEVSVDPRTGRPTSTPRHLEVARLLVKQPARISGRQAAWVPQGPLAQ